MDILELKTHLPSVEGGRWVDRQEVPALQDVRVKLRGFGSKACRDLMGAKERAAPQSDRDGVMLKMEARGRIANEVMAEACLMDIEGLTIGGKPASADDIRPLLHLPEYGPLAGLLAQAAAKVDQTRESKIAELSGN